MDKRDKQIKKLTIRLYAGMFLMFFMLIAGIIVFSNFLYIQQLEAFTSKGSGGILTAADWNSLLDDFVPQPSGCAAGQVVQWDGSNWVCGGGLTYNEITGLNLSQPDGVEQVVNLPVDSIVFLSSYSRKSGGADTRSGSEIRIDGVACSGDRENTPDAGFGQYMSATCIKDLPAGNYTFRLENREGTDLDLTLWYLIMPK